MGRARRGDYRYQSGTQQPTLEFFRGQYRTAGPYPKHNVKYLPHHPDRAESSLLGRTKSTVGAKFLKRCKVTMWKRWTRNRYVVCVNVITSERVNFANVYNRL